ncbi:MAG: hypothetical protein ACR2QE_14635, partial [Acidimicrobiales bacterium]
MNSRPGPDLSDTLSGVQHAARLDPPTLRKADVETLSGVPHERSVRWWRAMGFPEAGDDELAFRQEDVEMVRVMDRLMQANLVDDDDVL